MSRKRRKQVLWITCVIVLLLVPFVAAFGIHLKQKGELIKVVSYTHNLTKCLEAYVQDQARFPEDLQSLVRYRQSQYGDSEQWLLQVPFGGKLTYSRPQPTASDKTEVLTVTYRTNRIVVARDFSRRVE